MRNRALLVGLLFTLAFTAFAEKPPSADKVLAEAKARAKTEQKSILVVFGATWCTDCNVLDTFFRMPEVKGIFDKHFVLVHLNVFEEAGEHPQNNNPGSDRLIAKFGGVRGDKVSLPYLVVLDSDTKPIITSNRPTHANAKGENIGFPGEPDEIEWFLRMLKQGAPNLTDDESEQISTAVKQAQG